MSFEMDGNGCGRHTVNSNNELFYIHSNNNIHKLSKDMKTHDLLRKVRFGPTGVFTGLRSLMIYWLGCMEKKHGHAQLTDLTGPGN